MDPLCYRYRYGYIFRFSRYIYFCKRVLSGFTALKNLSSVTKINNYIAITKGIFISFYFLKLVKIIDFS